MYKVPKLYIKKYLYSALILGLVACNSDPVICETDVVVDAQEEESEQLFGFSKDEYVIYQGRIQKNEFLADLLLPHHVTYQEIDELAKKTRETFDVRKMRADKDYAILCSKDSIEKACYFIYEIDIDEYVVFNLNDNLGAEIKMKELQVVEKQAEGIITSSLFETLAEQNLSPVLAMKLGDIYAWTIDFYRLQKGDNFKVIYEDQYADDEYAGVGNILACVFEHEGHPFYAMRFETEDGSSYYDEKGASLRKTFLKSPLKFGRMSSRYSNNRFHPVQKRYKAHRGTDYAAPTGTNILATGDGVVLEASRTKYNGKYVKIRHNSTFSTQYLHMSKIAVQKGQHVQQGETIGYVGSTGLATGPHVCYRFWKNGKQVDHLRENFEPQKPVGERYKVQFEATRDEWMNRLLSDNELISFTP